MIRNAIATLILAVLIAVIALTVRPNSDAAAIFGPGGAELDALDTPAGREVIIALEAPDLAARNAAATTLTAMLASEPLVATIRSGATPPSEPFLDWLWQNRFQLAPPSAADFEPAAMAKSLNEARALMTSAVGMAVADRLLRDPTGSYARLVEQLKTASNRLAQQDGIWQSKDKAAALLFVTLKDRPFETNETAVLAARIRTAASEAGVTPHLLGQRIISAEISAATASASTLVAGLAAALLLIWLIWSLRSVTALLSVMLPLALGFAAATLTVQTVFGSVHVIALGFGGALTGLALDYPLHLLGHGKSERSHAGRLVLIGAITTGIGFIAMLGSGVPALMQTGVFIASGLIIAAIAARILLSEASANPRSLPLERLGWTLPFKPWIEAALAIGGIFALFAVSTAEPKTLFDPPAHVTASIERMRSMVDLPSGRHALSVTGETLPDLLGKQTALIPLLDQAIEQGALQSYSALAQVLGGNPAELPPLGVFVANAEAGLAKAGMAPSFAKIQEAAYREAYAALPITPEALSQFDETKPLAARLQSDGTGWREQIRLTGVTDPNALAKAIAPSGVDLIDLVAPIKTGLANLRRTVILWLGLGALGAFVCLALGLRNPSRAVEIARTSCGALGLTLIAITLISGAPSVFQIIALTLVVGIGIDYGLFLRAATSPAQHITACRSVALCAGSTLIAFTVMAFSSVKLLHEIGLTVSLGVLAMLLLNLARTQNTES